MFDLIRSSDSSTTRRKAVTFLLILGGFALALTAGWAPQATAQCNWTAGTGTVTETCGTVGIGTTDPTEGGQVGSKLTIRQADGGTGLAVMSGTGAKRFAVNVNANGSWTLFDGTGGSWAAGLTQTGGNLGLGTTNPLSKLHVSGGNFLVENGGVPYIHLQTNMNAGGKAGVTAHHIFGPYNDTSGDPGALYIGAGMSPTGGRNNIYLYNYACAGNTCNVPTIGIWADNTALSGNATISGNVTVGGNIAAKYQDVAEWVPGHGALPSGTVVVLDEDRSNQVLPSQEPYDTRVAGVVSDTPGIILGEAGDGKVKVATTGRVRVRVDATRQAVKVGDLLVTGSKEGVAMKSEPLEVAGRRMHLPGTIIGKALEPLPSGEGEILVLLSLQ